MSNSLQFLEAADVYFAMNSSRRGLSEHDASRRLGIFGPNKIVEPPKPHVLLQFFSHFVHLMALVSCPQRCVSSLHSSCCGVRAAWR